MTTQRIEDLAAMHEHLERNQQQCVFLNRQYMNFNQIFPAPVWVRLRAMIQEVNSLLDTAKATVAMEKQAAEIMYEQNLTIKENRMPQVQELFDQIESEVSALTKAANVSGEPQVLQFTAMIKPVTHH